MPKGDPNSKFKGRVVFQGNNVRDQNYIWAVFQELWSCPATIEASNAADCYGCFEGNDVMQADAEQAYIQAELRGTETWVGLRRMAKVMVSYAAPGVPTQAGFVRPPR